MIVTATLHPCIDKSFKVDRVIPDRKLSGHDVRLYPGGGGLNASRVIHRLGGRPRALWTAADRPLGQLLGELLDAEAIDHTPLPVSEDVRENVIVTDESTGEQYRFGTPGPALSQAEQRAWLDHLREHAGDAAYVVFSGSLPPGAPIGWYAELIDAAGETSKVVVDTKQQALAAALEIGVFLIKPNVSELSDVLRRDLGDDDEIERAARDLIDRGACQAAIVSLGRGGAMLVTAELCRRFAAPPVKKKSKVGAGDSLLGATVWALDEGRSIDDAALLGVAAGAATVMTEGTELCHAEDVERLYDSMRRREEL